MHVGGVAIWLNLSPDASTVTDATGMGLYQSDQMKKDGSFVFRFFGAGTYPYVDLQNPDATGTVRVPLGVTPTRARLGATYQFSWGDGPAPSGFRYEVQLHRLGGGVFSSFYSGRAPGASFTPAKAGTYEVRARVAEPSMHATSGWSQAVRFLAK